MKKSMKKHTLKLQKSPVDKIIDGTIQVLIFVAIIILIKILIIYT